MRPLPLRLNPSLRQGSMSSLKCRKRRRLQSQNRTRKKKSLNSISASPIPLFVRLGSLSPTMCGILSSISTTRTRCWTMQADTDTSRFLPHRRATDINAGISPSTGKSSTRQSPRRISRSRRAVSSRSVIFEKEGLYDLQRSISFMGSGGVPEPWL